MCTSHRCPDRPSQRPPPRAALLFRALLLFVAALTPIAPARSADRDTEQRDADARQKLFVRRALSEDRVLGPHVDDIWVEVRGLTVTLSGTVPSVPLKQRAAYLAGQVKGIAEVRGDNLLVPDKGSADVPSPFAEGVPPAGLLAGNPRDSHTTQTPVPLNISIPSPAPQRPRVEMLAPQPLPDTPDLSSAAEALRRKEERFRRLKIEVRQKTLFVSGTVARWDDAAALADALRRLPGVGLVMLDNVRVDPAAPR